MSIKDPTPVVLLAEKTDRKPISGGEAQLRAVLQGDIRQALPLAQKVFASLVARYYLRRCTRLGRWVRVQGRPLVQNRGIIEIGDRTMIFSTTVRAELVTQPGGRLEIGEQSCINYGVSLSAHQLVHIGNRCLIGPYTNILDNNYHDILDRTRTPPSRPVVIGDDVWIGRGAIILPGVTIGDHAVIGAGAVVMEDIPARSIALGNPAKVIQKF